MPAPLSRPRLSYRRGGVTPLTVLCLALLLGVVAVAVDGGILMEERRHAQATADAAALAAAADLFTNYASNQGVDSSSHTAQASALATAAANGFSNDGVQSVVTVTVSPSNYQGGPNAGKPLPAGYVEVIVQSNANRIFSNVFGSAAVPVRARAVARGRWTPVDNKVVALNTNASGAVSVGGRANLNINGGLLVNSNSSSAVNVSANATLSALSISLNSGGGGLVGSILNGVLGLLGGLLGLGGGGGSPPPTNYGPPSADPFRSLPDPTPAQLGLTVQGNNLQITGGTTQLYPGVYNGGITLSQGASVTLHANADGSPGIYFLQGGGLNVSGPSSLTMVNGETAGVMIYNNWQGNGDAINLAGTGPTVLAPPSSGTYQGMTIFQKRGTALSPAPALTIIGSGKVNISGTIYAAYSDVTLTGRAGNNTMCGQIVADTVSASGKKNINIDSGTQPTARTRILGLVE